MPSDTWPEWEQALASAAHPQGILPGAVLVGGSASALYAEHRLSTDADHVLTDPRQRYDQELAELESVACWKPARPPRTRRARRPMAAAAGRAPWPMAA